MNQANTMQSQSQPEKTTPKPAPAKAKCGIVMPISACDSCSEQHWSEVKSIITDAVESKGFEANLVSDADDVGIIQKRIIQNLYENPIVICDVSAKNPNVMFELGMRLAFDKPTIIVKDDKTSYSFDTSPIEHIEYPRDLRFSKIVEFKRNLADKVEATHARSQTDPSYTTFLKHFGSFSVATLETKEVSKDEYLLEELRDLRRLIASRMPLDASFTQAGRQTSDGKNDFRITPKIHSVLTQVVEEAIANVKKLDGIPSGSINELIYDSVMSDRRIAELECPPSVLLSILNRKVRQHFAE